MSNKCTRLWATAALVGFVSLLLGVVTHAAWLGALDAAAYPTASITTAFTVIATIGSPMVAIGATVILAAIVWRSQKPLAYFLIASQFAGSAIAMLVKLGVRRLRPAHQLVADTGFSFPSGHVFCTSLFVFALLLVILPHLPDPEVQLVAVLVGCLWIAIVAVSRVYLHDHYASDVCASITLAAGYWGWLSSVRTRIQPLLTLKGSH